MKNNLRLLELSLDPTAQPSATEQVIARSVQSSEKYETIILPQSGERILEIPKKADALAYAKGICESKFDPAVVPSKKYLDRIWRTDDEFKNIKVHRTLPFSKCDTCSKFDTDYSNTTDSVKRAEIIAKKREHKALISRDKDGYYSRGAKAVMRPADFLSLIVDGADQEKYSLPYRPRPMKTVDNYWRQKTHVMGAISHGRQVFAFVATDDIKQGNNVTIEVIHRVLLKTIKDEGLWMLEPDAPLMSRMSSNTEMLYSSSRVKL